MDCMCDSLALRFWVGNGVSLLVVSQNVLMCVGHLIRTDRGSGSFSWIAIDYLRIGTGSRLITLRIGTGSRLITLQIGTGSRLITLRIGTGSRLITLRIGTGSRLITLRIGTGSRLI